MINVINSFFGSSGYSSHGRSLANALNKLTKVKISANLQPGWETQVNDQELEMIKREEDYEINLIITHPLHWKAHLNAKRNFCYLIHEGSHIPKWMLQECNNPKINKIIVPSQHTYDAIMNTDGTRDESKFIIIPHGVDLKTFYPIPNMKSDKPFVFLMNKGLRNLEDRGGIQYGLRAYLQEFTESDNVLMIIKVNPAYGVPNLLTMFPDLKKKGMPKVRFITENYTTKQLNELYNECDVFVSPTRAESFNLPCLEAMACGKPVITTDFGGQTDFCNNNTGWLIDYEMTEVKHEVEYEGIMWATPKIDDLKQKLRTAFESHRRSQKESLWSQLLLMGRDAQIVAKELTWDICANKIFNLTDKFIK